MADDTDSSSLDSDSDCTQDHKYDAEEVLGSEDAVPEKRSASKTSKTKARKEKTRCAASAKSPQLAPSSAVSSSCSGCDAGDSDIETTDGDDEKEPVSKKRRSDGSSSCVSPIRRPNVVISNEEGCRSRRREFPPTDENNSCPVCEKKTSFKTKETRDNHIRKKHLEVYNGYEEIPKRTPGATPKRVFRIYPEHDATFSCPVCEKPHKSLQSRNNHIRGQHKEVYDKYDEVPTLSSAAVARAPLAASGKGVKKRKHPKADEACSCPYCDWVNPGVTEKQRKSARLHHIYSRHGDKVNDTPFRTDTPRRTYICDADSIPECACGRDFGTDVNAFRRHQSKATGVHAHRCEHCGHSVATAGDLWHHLEECAVLHAGKTYYCDMPGCPCPEKPRPTPAAVKQHQRGALHISRERVYRCEAVCADTGLPCTFTHYHPSKIASHAQYVHTEDRQFPCLYIDGDGMKCSAAFKSASDLGTHAGTHVTVRSFPCATCDKLYTTVRLRNSHERNAHGNLRFKCSQCTSTFRVKVVRDQHEYTHLEERCYECTICGDEFRQQVVLDNHVVYVHTHSRKYPCTVCDVVETSPSRLATHLYTHSEAYNPNRSKFESEFAAVLKRLGIPYKEQVEVPRRKLRLDFEVEFNGRRVCIELDGQHHFSTIFSGVAGKLSYLRQCSYDVDKSRVCRREEMLLLRFTEIPTESALLAALTTVTLCPSDMSDYVSPELWTSALARELVVADISADDAVLAAKTVLRTFDFGMDDEEIEAIDWEKFVTGIFVHMLRLHSTKTLDEFCEVMGDTVAEAACVLAASMWEFAYDDCCDAGSCL
jgi:hypothetical protein